MSNADVDRQSVRSSDDPFRSKKNFYEPRLALFLLICNILCHSCMAITLDPHLVDEVRTEPCHDLSSPMGILSLASLDEGFPGHPRSVSCV